jgi:phage tail sheath protein FI
MPTYDVPGVYIEEQTGPGVIAGVGTSTAAFIGPASRGPLNEARRVSSFEEFLALYALPLADGTLWPYIDSPRRFYLAHGVRGFFENGGRQAFVVRVGTARATTWNIENQDNEVVFRLRARQEGIGGDQITVQVQATSATPAAGHPVATGSATVSAINGTDLTVSNAAPFRVGDPVTEAGPPAATITAIKPGNILTLSNTIAGLAVGDTLRTANITPTLNTFRMADTTGIRAGSVVLIRGDDAANPGTAVENYAIVESVDQAGFVTLAASPARANSFNLAVAQPPVLISQEFRLIITAPNTPAETFTNLSLEPMHSNYVFAAVDSDSVEVVPPATPPLASTFPDRLVAPVAGNVPVAVAGQNDDPGAVGAPEYEAGLRVLREIDDVNLVCIPDAAANADWQAIQLAMIAHCLEPKLQDRFAILDSRPGAPPSGPGSVEQHRQAVESERGFAALYYPWLEVREPIPPTRPRPAVPTTIYVPPSGHMAGVFARTDNERGVHKAPANTGVRGVLGLERRLSDGQHGPLNLLGVNVLRIFPGSAQVVVWGARTTVDPDVTDWIYVNVRRLLLFIEESIEEGIRFAVFEPNNLALWQKLRRTISEFLTRVWRDGALFGAKPEVAFYVRIDEALNPPSTRALGRLYIEIAVAPVRPAEFIIVRIGLWDGGSEVSEG